MDKVNIPLWPQGHKVNVKVTKVIAVFRRFYAFWRTPPTVLIEECYKGTGMFFGTIRKTYRKRNFEFLSSRSDIDLSRSNIEIVIWTRSIYPYDLKVKVTKVIAVLLDLCTGFGQWDLCTGFGQWDLCTGFWPVGLMYRFWPVGLMYRHLKFLY